MKFTVLTNLMIVDAIKQAVAGSSETGKADASHSLGFDCEDMAMYDRIDTAKDLEPLTHTYALLKLNPNLEG